MNDDFRYMKFIYLHWLVSSVVPVDKGKNEVSSAQKIFSVNIKNLLIGKWHTIRNQRTFQRKIIKIYPF